mmetsp:Transcript_48395/g.58575  ORF Transcript_48395/g.58575 Transcript_48395/m.58575 type:complete len:224 (-) Transcript_48395:1145-1816(-)
MVCGEIFCKLLVYSSSNRVKKLAKLPTTRNVLNSSLLILASSSSLNRSILSSSVSSSPVCGFSRVSFFSITLSAPPAFAPSPIFIFSPSLPFNKSKSFATSSAANTPNIHMSSLSSFNTPAMRFKYRAQFLHVLTSMKSSIFLFKSNIAVTKCIIMGISTRGPNSLLKRTHASRFLTISALCTALRPLLATISFTFLFRILAVKPTCGRILLLLGISFVTFSF